MGFSNRTYSDLLALVQALAGVDSFTTAEQTKILATANRRLNQAFNASPMWPRYVIGAQARPANDGLISFDYNASSGIRTGSAETRAQTTVTIVCTAAVTFVAGMEVTISGLSGTVNPNGTYKVASVSTTTIENDTFTYEVSTTNTGTETYSGTATITPVAVPDIADFIRVWDGNPFSSSGAYDVNFYVDADGAHLSGDHEGLGGYWVGFKKEWPGPYLASATDIPAEFFFYAAHATYADFLRSDGQVDKALAEEKAAENYLVLELDKAATVKNNNRIFSRIQTYVSTQARW